MSQLEAMAKEQPNDLISQMRLGEAYEKQGAWDKAAAAFEQALKLNPKLAGTRNQACTAQCRAAPEQGKSSRLRKESASSSRQLTPRSPAFSEKLPTRVAISRGLTVFCRKPLASAKMIRHSSRFSLGCLQPGKNERSSGRDAKSRDD